MIAVLFAVLALHLPPGCFIATPALTGDPEHNAFVQGRSDVDPFHIGARPRRAIVC